MFNICKCIKCDKFITYVTMETVDATAPSGSALKEAYFTCPHCNAVLGVQIDPFALKTDIVNAVVKAPKRS
jgi:hypothetical protein